MVYGGVVFFDTARHIVQVGGYLPWNTHQQTVKPTGLRCSNLINYSRILRHFSVQLFYHCATLPYVLEACSRIGDALALCQRHERVKTKQRRIDHELIAYPELWALLIVKYKLEEETSSELSSKGPTILW